MQPVFSPHEIARIRIGRTPVTEKYPKSRDFVIFDVRRRSSWQDPESWLIITLSHLSISELLIDGWIGVRSRNEILRPQESE
jgi:hypothetical protein